MKRAVSISIGSSRRDKAVVIELLGEKISLERIGTDGDMEKAANLFRELDGKVDAFGFGGADLGIMVAGHWYPFHSVKSIVRHVKKTPVLDGTGLKNTLENRLGAFLSGKLESHLRKTGRKALVTAGADRWGMTTSLLDNGFECVFGDLMFGLGIPVSLKSRRALVTLARLLMPIVGRVPFQWLYPTGEKQEQRNPKWVNYYCWATVIAGDCHYIKRHMPDKLEGKVIATNTTTPADIEAFRCAGVKYLVTTTPVLDGRSFGTNLMEAALVAISGARVPLSHAELDHLLDKLGLQPQLMTLE
jgi:hypothetical protein